jgi:hypothetical protein
MSKISKFVKLDKNVLLEYIYDDGNLISEAYDVLVNSKDRKRSYLSTSTSATNNTAGNQLFILDNNTRRLGKINSTAYSFLEIKNFAAPAPIRHDTLRFHLPINWTFGEYLGFYIKVYGFDSQSLNKYEISNYYFDMTDVGQSYMLNFTSPPLLFQEKLWGKNIQIEIPALSEISSQLTGGLPTNNSLNANITNGAGFNMSSPIFIEFSFITSIQTINGVTTYLSSNPLITSIPQTPEFERLGLMIEDSPNGDFFEIYGTYNGTIAGFNKFINDSVSKGNRYYVQYNITMYEQNIRGKTTTYTVTDGFNETIEYRPIIKFSTTTAIIDVEMRLIDQVDESYIIRRATYGMLQDEVSKYSTNLMKINLSRSAKPKIYNIKSAVNPSLVGISNSMGSISVYNAGKSSATPRSSFQNSMSKPVTEVIRVPYPVLVDRFNIMAKSENSMLDNKNFYGFGKIIVNLYPFDNVLKFIIATGTPEAPQYFNLTSFSEIKFVIRNDDINIDFPLYAQAPENDLSVGNISFKVSQSKYAEIKKIYNRGVNVFYITGLSQDTTSVIYTGLFKPYDNAQSVADLNDQAKPKPDIILDPTAIKETALVFRKPIKEMSPKLKPSKLKDLASSKLTGSVANIDSSKAANPSTKTYQAKKPFFVKELANIVGMKLDEFLKINGFKDSGLKIKIGQDFKVDAKSNFNNPFISEVKGPANPGKANNLNIKPTGKK